MSPNRSTSPATQAVGTQPSVDNLYMSLYNYGMVRRLHSFYLDPEHSAALKVLKRRDGTPEGEQVRRALVDWFRKKRVKLGQRTQRGGRMKK